MNKYGYEMVVLDKSIVELIISHMNLRGTRGMSPGGWREFRTRRGLVFRMDPRRHTDHFHFQRFRR